MVRTGGDVKENVMRVNHDVIAITVADDVPWSVVMTLAGRGGGDVMAWAGRGGGHSDVMSHVI